ncbi:CopG family transcriptional regulator [Erwinia sp. JH02]|uniref:CopG family transcriptional regulator n=1 Tax=Erwinia sp. JH02 TaxID=2733394 RepID=UPI001488F11E|nr:CopG family transcriptional regulator [Erwinia sp. JH02]NNS10018.1 CopG family transcriptional regulator [Erwinia sp. JH02]
MLKKPSQKNKVTRAVADVSEDQADRLASILADKPYGDEKKLPEPQEKLTRTTISLPESLLRQCEDIALRNKRNGIDPKNVSALVRAAMEKYLNT